MKLRLIFEAIKNYEKLLNDYEVIKMDYDNLKETADINKKNFIEAKYELDKIKLELARLIELNMLKEEERLNR